MLGGGVEPPRLAAIGPQPIVSASFTIPAEEQCEVESSKWKVKRRKEAGYANSFTGGRAEVW